MHSAMRNYAEFAMTYHHQTFEPLTFGRARARFLTGEDTPSAYLDRCIDVIEAREPVVKAWASLRIEGARRDAEASTARYAAGQPLSTIDGMPIGVKDLIATRELPTTLGIAGNEQAVTQDDSACIQAMQQAGAILLGKVTTTELGAGWPSPTTNPFDPLRTPGGSSSGSAAAVGAGMIPVSIGTQVAGSILRPASYCGNVALKPTMGAIHRGERLGLSHACIGVHAGDLDDLWAAMVEIAVRAGGDPGYPGLYGDLPTPAPARPERLAIMEGPGWAVTEPGAKAAFEGLLDKISAQGVSLVRAQDNPALAAFHAFLPQAMAAVGTLIFYENRSLLANLMARMPEKLSPAAVGQYRHGQTLTREDYRAAIRTRDEGRRLHAALASECDAVISLSSPGLPPLIDDPDRPEGQMATGNPIYNVAPSVLGAPGLTLPLLTMADMPLGVQIMGQPHEDQRLVGYGVWAMAALKGS